MSVPGKNISLHYFKIDSLLTIFDEFGTPTSLHWRIIMRLHPILRLKVAGLAFFTWTINQHQIVLRGRLYKLTLWLEVVVVMRNKPLTSQSICNIYQSTSSGNQSSNFVNNDIFHFYHQREELFWRCELFLWLIMELLIRNFSKDTKISFQII